MVPIGLATAAKWSRRLGAAHEPVPSVHPATCGDYPADGGYLARRRAGLPPSAGGRPTPGRLSDHPGRHVLSRGESRRYGVIGHGTTGASIRADARAEPDDLDELPRQLG